MDDDDNTPLHRLRAFGAGISRRPVAFVRASDPDAAAPPDPRMHQDDSSVANTYLSIVMAGQSDDELLPKPSPPPPPSTPSDKQCTVCSLPITTPSSPDHRHESSIVHQVKLSHSYPPSSLDRRRMGLSVLAAQGWDPDSRVGLGPAGREGIPTPIKPHMAQRDTLGLGIARASPKEVAARRERQRQEVATRGITPGRKERRNRRAVEERRLQRLRDAFYGREDVERHLRPGLPWE